MKEKKAFDLPVRLLLGLSAILALLPPSLLGTYALVDLISRDRKAQTERLHATARSLAASVDRELDALREMAVVFATSRFVLQGDLARFDELARDAAKTVNGNIVLIDRAYRQLVNTALPRGSLLPKTNHTEAIDRVFATGRHVVTNLVRTTTTNATILAIIVPVFVDDEPKYALALQPDLALFSRVLQRVPLPEGWLAAVDDAQGQIIARTVKPEEFIGTKARLTRSEGSGLVPLTDLEGRPSLLAFYVSPETRFRAVVWTPEESFYEASHRLTTWLAGLGLTVLALTLAAAYTTGNVLSRPVIGIASAARQLARGEPVRHEPSVMREANVAGRAMEQAAGIISDREVSLRQQTETTRLLMRELVHRIKNLMAVVSAIGRQTGRSATNYADFQARFEARLAGLSSSVDLLVSGDWRSVGLRDLIVSQLRPFADLSRFEITGPSLLLTPEATQNLGLALHELATNAAKHGALSVTQGSVAIRWRVDGDQFELSWKERGGPSVVAPSRTGFGHAVVADMTGSALMGSASLRFEPDGVAWVLRVPIGSVVREV
jgi:two-component sensor histidine kinase